MQNWQAAEQILLSILGCFSAIYKGAERRKARAGAAAHGRMLRGSSPPVPPLAHATAQCAT